MEKKKEKRKRNNRCSWHGDRRSHQNSSSSYDIIICPKHDIMLPLGIPFTFFSHHAKNFCHCKNLHQASCGFMQFLSFADKVFSLQFYGYISTKLDLVNMKVDFLNRNVNEGFSGGEKKRNEIFQLEVWIISPVFLSVFYTDSKSSTLFCTSWFCICLCCQNS